MQKDKEDRHTLETDSNNDQVRMRARMQTCNSLAKDAVAVAVESVLSLSPSHGVIVIRTQFQRLDSVYVIIKYHIYVSMYVYTYIQA